MINIPIRNNGRFQILRWKSLLKKLRGERVKGKSGNRSSHAEGRQIFPCQSYFPWMCIQSPYCFMQRQSKKVPRIIQSTLFITTLDKTTKIHYTDNLTVMKLSLKRWQLIRFYVRIMYLIIQETYDLDIC